MIYAPSGPAADRSRLDASVRICCRKMRTQGPHMEDRTALLACSLLANHAIPVELLSHE